jgi:very-short-patch-repair endonuclease
MVQRTSMLLPADVVHREDGIRLTTPPMTVFGCAAHLDDLDLTSMVEDCLRRRLFTMPTLLDVGRRVVAPGRAGSARFTRVVSSRPGWLRPADSHLEVVLFDALGRAGIPGLVRQHPLVLPGGRPIRFDVASPALRWGVEVDHVAWHGGRLDVHKDKARDRAAHRCGWQVDRVTDIDVVHDLDATVAELVELHHQRLHELGAHR